MAPSIKFPLVAVSAHERRDALCCLEPLRRATKAARRGETEFREMPPRRLQLTALAVGIVQMVDGAEINVRVRRPQSFRAA